MNTKKEAAASTDDPVDSANSVSSKLGEGDNVVQHPSAKQPQQASSGSEQPNPFTAPFSPSHFAAQINLGQNSPGLIQAVMQKLSTEGADKLPEVLHSHLDNQRVVSELSINKKHESECHDRKHSTGRLLALLVGFLLFTALCFYFNQAIIVTDLIKLLLQAAGGGAVIVYLFKDKILRKE